MEKILWVDDKLGRLNGLAVGMPNLLMLSLYH